MAPASTDPFQLAIKALGEARKQLRAAAEGAGAQDPWRTAVTGLEEETTDVAMRVAAVAAAVAPRG